MNLLDRLKPKGSVVDLETGESHSGKFQVRLPKSLHRQLAEIAQEEGMSLNQYITVVLAKAINWTGKDKSARVKEDTMVRTMMRKVYGDRKRSYLVVSKPGDWIELWVCHDNQSVRAMLQEHGDDPRYLLQHLSTYAKGHFRAHFWLSEVINDYRPHFESGHVKIVLDADCESVVVTQ